MPARSGKLKNRDEKMNSHVGARVTKSEKTAINNTVSAFADIVYKAHGIIIRSSDIQRSLFHQIDQMIKAGSPPAWPLRLYPAAKKKKPKQ